MMSSMKAWIIKWDWIGDHAAVDDPYINILSARVSPGEVLEYVQRCYASSEYSLSEQIAQARYNKPSIPPYQAHFDVVEGHSYENCIVCGHNPHIVAFKADSVHVDEESGELMWDKESVKNDREKFSAAVKRIEARLDD